MPSRAVVPQPLIARSRKSPDALWVSNRPIEPHSLPWPIQATLAVGAVNDPLEREADRVAEQVASRRESVFLSSSTTAPYVQRKCKACADEEAQGGGHACESCANERDGAEKETLSRKAAGRSNASEGTAAPAAVREVLRSPGQPLDAGTRAFFEPRFGYDFSRVRVHSDAAAAASAQSVDALAFTVGRNVVFGPGQFAPNTAQGQRLLAHELTHVVQQSRLEPGGVQAPVAVVRRKPAANSTQVKVEVDRNATCNLDQHRKIEPAVYKANEWLSRTIPAIDAVLSGAKTRQAQAASAALQKHFHSTSRAVVTYVRDRLSTIQRDIFTRQNFRINCPPASDVHCGGRGGSERFAAVVPEGNPNEINFCDLFFERKEEDRASTIIHEFGHTMLGLTERQQIIDRGYQWDAYYYYLTTGEALTNAESYAMLSREVATGFSPARGFIVDTLDEDCPDAWVPIVSDAITKARTWNHRAALSTPARHEFSRAYKTLDTQLKSSFNFKCRVDGGGRCADGHVAYWWALGDLRICPTLIGLRTPDERGLALLAALFGLQSLVSGSEKRARAAREARDLFTANVPSTADVLAGP
jgi:hypothetical protein